MDYLMPVWFSLLGAAVSTGVVVLFRKPDGRVTELEEALGDERLKVAYRDVLLSDFEVRMSLLVGLCREVADYLDADCTAEGNSLRKRLREGADKLEGK